MDLLDKEKGLKQARDQAIEYLDSISSNYDNSKEQMNKKIRESNILKNPYIIIIGDKERDNNLISYKKLGEENTITISKEEFLLQIKEEISKR